MSTDTKETHIKNIHHHYGALWLVVILVVYLLVTNIPSCSNNATPTIQHSTLQHSTLQYQAALGGAAVPFPNDNPSPMPLISPLGDSIEEIADSPSTNISEQALPSNLQVDNGHRQSVRLLRPLFRRIR